MPHVVTAEIVATVLTVDVALGDRVTPEAPVIVLESMKMEIPVLAEVAGAVSEVLVTPGDVVHDGDPMLVIDTRPER